MEGNNTRKFINSKSFRIDAIEGELTFNIIEVYSKKMTYETIKKFARYLRKNETPAEKVFWEKIRGKQFMDLKFNRQFIIEHANIMSKKSYFIADFHCFQKKLIVEIDGKIHYTQLEYDKIREDVLKEMGYKIIRFRNEEVLNEWKNVATKLKNFIAD
ncbi:MAG: endonuclease domain-containing protein [Saprospiraceae bacterium]